MRWRALLILSLVLNGVLAGWMLWQARRAPAPMVTAEHGLRDPLLTNRPRTVVVMRKQFFTWSEVESADYLNYIANLRDIGCPEPTIRDIIVADVNQLYARKRATEVITVEQQWWRSEPDPEIEELAAAGLEALDAERRDLLEQLLGPAWNLDDTALLSFLEPRTTVALDGTVLGELSPEVKLKVRELVAREQDKTRAYLLQTGHEGRVPDPAELARLQQQTRTELAGLLNGAQLEEFLLRYSDNAEDLRQRLGELGHFQATPDEFRSLFRVLDPLEQQIRLYYSGSDEASLRSRTALEQQMAQAIKNALPTERYDLYTRLQDPNFRYAMDVAGDAEDPKAVAAVYLVAQETAAERDRVETDPALSPAEKEVRLKELELEQLRANLTALGQLPLPSEPAAPPVGTQHLIRPGETLERLATTYGVTVGELLELNRGRDPRTLRVGETMIVPPPPTPIGRGRR
jgi:LysM repeat protein